MPIIIPNPNAVPSRAPLMQGFDSQGQMGPGFNPNVPGYNVHMPRPGPGPMPSQPAMYNQMTLEQMNMQLHMQQHPQSFAPPNQLPIQVQPTPIPIQQPIDPRTARSGPPPPQQQQQLPPPPQQQAQQQPPQDPRRMANAPQQQPAPQPLPNQGQRMWVCTGTVIFAHPHIGHQDPHLHLSAT